jgi:hypothetical protein
MYDFLRGLRWRQGTLVEGPAFLGSLVIAELFYKFHSFTLECVAFLATWVVASGVLGSVARLLPERANDAR